jgi:hypothetical protein
MLLAEILEGLGLESSHLDINVRPNGNGSAFALPDVEMRFSIACRHSEVESITQKAETYRNTLKALGWAKENE